MFVDLTVITLYYYQTVSFTFFFCVVYIYPDYELQSFSNKKSEAKMAEIDILSPFFLPFFNLALRVLSLLLKSTLVAAGHVSAIF